MFREYKIHLGSSWKKIGRIVDATVTVARAARENGLAATQAELCPVEVVREALSYPPEEELPPGLVTALEQVSATLSAQGGHPAHKLVCAQALLILGPAGGSRRREQLWNGGRADDLARTTFADNEVWLIRRLLDWTPWIESSRRRMVEEQGYDPSEAASIKCMVPLEAIARLIESGQWGG